MPFALTAAVLALLVGGCGSEQARSPWSSATDPTVERPADTGSPSPDVDRDGWTVAEGDCNDADPAISPGTAEVVADGIDQDCDGGDTCYADVDGDMYGSSTTVLSEDRHCTGEGESQASTDCDDGDPNVSPEATEVVADGIDQDCDGHEICYADFDGDGYGYGTLATLTSDDLDCVDPGESPVATDCDETDASVHPDTTEVCNGRDDDCDGLVDDDLLCEDCANGIDDDGDGLVDCEDGDCVEPPCKEDCRTPEDDDDDGLVNCEDDDCWVAVDCAVASRVRAGARVWWSQHWWFGGLDSNAAGTGSATSIDGTLWLQPRFGSGSPSRAVPCMWHVDRVYFEGSFRHVDMVTSRSYARVSRTGFVLSSACPLPDGMSAYLPAPFPRRGRVAGWGGWSYPEWAHSWYAGSVVTLGTWESSSSTVGWGSGSWRIAPVETGDTFPPRPWP
jgi:hypothetical protein